MSDIVGGSYDDGSRIQPHDERAAEEAKFNLFMVPHPVLGFLKYFFAPIIFAILSLWAIAMLVFEVLT